jgi:hypothetical protein
MKKPAGGFQIETHRFEVNQVKTRHRPLYAGDLVCFGRKLDHPDPSQGLRPGDDGLLSIETAPIQEIRLTTRRRVHPPAVNK